LDEPIAPGMGGGNIDEVAGSASGANSTLLLVTDLK
jgi:hypothetical protein